MQVDLKKRNLIFVGLTKYSQICHVTFQGNIEIGSHKTGGL